MAEITLLLINLLTQLCCTDYWKSCNEFIPAEKHLQTKAETYTIESYNSGIWYYLA